MHELLCPVGNMESLYQAVMNGADAVYLSGYNFGARKFATNFSTDELIEAINYCHLYGVKIYVTMNTLVKDDEVESFLNQVLFLHKNGVDAIIMQDFGMISLVRKMYPNLEIHASTQANNSSYDIIKMFYEMGVKRVVFSRELSLDEIKKIDIPIEKEVFIHGALCISYSGCCLMSSMIASRSGNRGECAGSCRLPYSLLYNDKEIVKNKYLLSTKEFNTSYHFKGLLDSDIFSFKIEGRMKSAEYVGFITRFYRNLIDNYDNINSLDEENNKLKTIYNREFTCGHLFNSSKDDLMNIKSPNHIGLSIGKVIEVTPKKIKLKLNRELNQQDGIRFLESGKGFIVNYLYDENGKLISSSNGICYVDNKVGLKECERVSKTLDFKLINNLKQLPKRLIPVTLKVIAKEGEGLSIEVSDGLNNVVEVGSIVSKAIKSPTTKERIKSQVERLGTTPFISKDTIIDSDDNIFINIKQINDLRRRVIDKLIKMRTTINNEVIVNKVSFYPIPFNNNPGITSLVYTEEQLITCLSLNLKRIYVNNYNLYSKYKEKNNVYYKVPRCLYNVSNKLEKNSLIGDYCDFSNNNLIGDYGLNVTNIYTAYYLYKMGLNMVTLSVELTQEEIISFINNFRRIFGSTPNIEVVGYGRYENMIIKDNILNLKENDYNYKLIDSRKRIFPTYFDTVNTYILNYENKELNNIKKIKKYSDIRVQFFDEDIDTVIKTVKKYQ